MINRHLAPNRTLLSGRFGIVIKGSCNVLLSTTRVFLFPLGYLFLCVRVCVCVCVALCCAVSSHLICTLVHTFWRKLGTPGGTTQTGAQHRRCFCFALPFFGGDSFQLCGIIPSPFFGGSKACRYAWPESDGVRHNEQHHV